MLEWGRRGSGFRARVDALWCVVRGHDVEWRTAPDAEAGCTGDILCETCGVLHWCRWYDGDRREKPCEYCGGRSAGSEEIHQCPDGGEAMRMAQPRRARARGGMIDVGVGGGRMGDRAVRVRFRFGRATTAVLAIPAALRETGALALGEVFRWPALGRALGLTSFGAGELAFRVTAVGTEGNLLGTGELVLHVV